MLEAQNQETYGRWQLGTGLPVIDYSPVVVREINAAVKSAFQRFPRGGHEVGGVLFGTRQDEGVQILAWRPIPCRHTLGPSFSLLQAEHDELAGILREYKKDGQLQNLVPIGWFHSHTRSDLLLTDSDLHLHNRHFPHAWQTAILLRPETAKPTRAGIFIKGPEGELPPRPVAIIEDVVEGNEDGAPPVFREEPPADRRSWSSEIPPPTFSALESPFAFLSKVRWGAWVTWVGLCGTVVLIGTAAWLPQSGSPYWDLIRTYWSGSAPPGDERPFDLRLIASGIDVAIRWNAATHTLPPGASATLVIWDGEQRTEIPIDGSRLRDGLASYSRRSDDLTVKLIVPVPDRDPISETARLVGSPPVPRAPVEPDAPGPKDLAALSLEKEQLEIALRVQTTESEELAQRLDSLEAIEKTRAAPVAAVPQPPPPRPAPPKPVLLEQRPEATSTTGAPSVRSAAGASPAYAGPASGRLIWTGVLGTGRVVSIQGRQPSTGSLSGQFPGVPIRVRAYPAQLSSNGLTIYTSNTAHSGAGVTEVPGPQNSWTGTTYKYAPELAGTVELVQVPREQNSWTGAALRAVGPNVSVIVLEWERLR